MCSEMAYFDQNNERCQENEIEVAKKHFKFKSTNVTLRSLQMQRHYGNTEETVKFNNKNESNYS